jgi:hypothetical protein
MHASGKARGVDAPLSMYLQPGSSTSSVQGYRGLTAQVLVNSHRPRADYSHDARLDVPPRLALQRLTKVQRGPVAGQSGWCGPSAPVSARRSPAAECKRAGRPAPARVRSSFARSGGSGMARRVGAERSPPPPRAIRSVQLDPCKCTARSAIVVAARNTGRPRCQTRGAAAAGLHSSTVGLHSSPAQFVQTTLCFELR